MDTNEDNMTAPPVAKRVNKKTSALEAENQRLQDQLNATLTEVQEFKDALKRRDEAERVGAEEAMANERRLRELLAAVKPIHRATREWSWPDARIALSRKLEFGHLKALVELYKQIAPS